MNNVKPIYPNRFHYARKDAQNTSTHFDCFDVSMRDGIIFVDTGIDIEKFNVDELSDFGVYSNTATLTALLARGGRQFPWAGG